MAAVTSDITPATRKRYELLETLAIVNQTPTLTVNRALGVPAWACAVTFLLDLTITGTTPLVDFTVSGGITAVRAGSLLDSTTDKFEFTAGGPAAITQLTTDTSTPITALTIGPGLQTDTTGSATANSAYAFTGYLPGYLIYTYILDGTTGDEDYAGTISAIWHPRS